MTDTSLTIADLRTRWFTLADLDRAQEIEFIHRLGVSLSELATALNCSPSLLTRLLQAAQASIEDRQLARQGVLSTRSLSRRSKACGARRTAMHGEEIAFERERAALQGSISILNWLADHNVEVADQSLVIGHVRSQLPLAKSAILQPQAIHEAKASADRKAEQAMPTEPMPAENDRVAGLVQRLAKWALEGIPDGRVRQSAFELAQSELDQIRTIADDRMRHRALELAFSETSDSPTPTA